MKKAQHHHIGSSVHSARTSILCFIEDIKKTKSERVSKREGQKNVYNINKINRYLLTRQHGHGVYARTLETNNNDNKK